MMRSWITGFFILSSSGLFGIEAEHHLLLCHNPPQSIIEKFTLTPSPESRREVYYLDDTRFRFFAAGVISRLRFSKGKKADFDLKIRPIQPKDLPADWVKNPQVKCEVDQYMNREVFSCRFRHQLKADFARHIIKNRDWLRLYSKEQLQFVRAIKKKDFPWHSVQAFGPTFLHQWTASRTPLSIEVVGLPTGEHLAALSLRRSYRPGEFEKRLVTLTQEKGLSVCEEQNSKTHRILKAHYIQLLHRDRVF